jgi:hypothetical protein
MLLISMALAASTTPEDNLKAWRECLRAKAEGYARLNEPAETVATASFAACKKEEEVIRQVPAETDYPELIPVKQRMVDAIVRDERGKLVQLVLDTRLLKKP